MRILLIQGYLGRAPDDSLVYPLGLAYVATALAHDGHDLHICDPNAGPDGLQQVRREIKRLAPHVVGISLRNIDTAGYIGFRYYYRGLSELLDLLEEAEATIMIGGAGFSTFPAQIMADHPRLAIGVVGEGEATAVEVLRCLGDPSRVAGVYLRKGPKVIFTGPRPFKTYTDGEWPRRDFCDIKPYLAVERSIGVQSYRGCPCECLYCNYPSLNGRRIRARTAQDVVDEIEDLHLRYGIREVIFADSLFDLKRPFARQICEDLVRRNLDVRWSAWFETHGFDEEWFHLARRAGCYRFCFSPDGASDATMAAMGKRCREGDVERILDLAANYPETAFRFTLFCSGPGQDWLDVWRSVCFVVRAHFVLPNSRCLLSWTRIYPNSKLFSSLVSSGEIGTQTDLLPSDVVDHRPLFYFSPSAPRLATPIMLATWKGAEMLRRTRKICTAVVRRLGKASARRSVDCPITGVESD